MIRYAVMHSSVPVMCLIGTKLSFLEDIKWSDVVAVRTFRIRYMMYETSSGIAKIWVDNSLFKASFATIIKSCQYMAVGINSIVEAFTASAALLSISILSTFMESLLRAYFIK